MGHMEKKMQTTTIYCGDIGITENMETAVLWGLGFLGFYLSALASGTRA